MGSDKTTVSVRTGDNEFWPVYGSVGNLHNNVRRAHGAGLVLIGFLAIPKGISSLHHVIHICSVIIWQRTNSIPSRQALHSEDSAANFFTYLCPKFLSRFDLE